MAEQVVTVMLTEDEAREFKLWMQHRDAFKKLLKANVFEITGGSAELHFNQGGDLAAIDIHVKAYRMVH